MSSGAIQYAPAGPTTQAFHDSNAFVRGIMGPIGCLAGDTLVVTEQGLVRIDALTRPTRVLSYDQRSDRFLFVLASASFPKGTDVLYRVLTPRGEWRAAGHHRVLCADGKYRSVESLAHGQSVPLCSAFRIWTNSVLARISSRLNDLRWLRTSADSKGRCGWLSRLCDRLLPLELTGDRARIPVHADAPIFVSVESLEERTHPGLPCGPLPKQGSDLPKEARRGDSIHAAGGRASRISQSIQAVQQFLSSVSGTVAKFARCSSFINSVTEGTIVSVTRCSDNEIYWDLQVPNTNNYVTSDGVIHHNSGKSVACCMEIVIRALAQRPGPDGIRRTRWVVVRNSYPELKSTTIATWTDWFKPQWFGKVKYDAPISHRLRLAHDCEVEILFMALDTPDDVKKLLSLEVTGAWLNEARELPKAVLDAVTGRVGRYPSKRDGGPTWFGVIMDTNPPSDDGWWYRLAEEERPESFEFFRQPSGMSDQAENLDNLPPNYYLNLLPGKPQAWIKVYVEAQYGSVADGRPVYPEYNDTLHVAPLPLQPYRGLPLYLGWDFGLTPAVTISQVSSRGQLRVLDELVSDDMGIEQFSNNIVKPFLAMKYDSMKLFSLIDPAGAQRAQTDERTCRDVLKKAGLHPSLAPTNSFTARREAVAHYLTRLVDGEPAFLMSPTCKTLRKAMNGEYKFKRVQIPGEERFKDAPDKNRFSHVAESLQYTCLHTAGGRESGKRKVVPMDKYRPASSAGY